MLKAASGQIRKPTWMNGSQTLY